MPEKVFPFVSLNDFTKGAIIFNGFLAVLGLSLGIYYFIKRIWVEEDRLRFQRIGELVKLLLDQLEAYDRVITPKIRAGSEKLTKKEQLELSRMFQHLQHFLESNQNLLAFSSDELQAIQDIQGAIDRSSLIRKKDLIGVENLQDEFYKTLKLARFVCWQKINDGYVKISRLSKLKRKLTRTIDSFLDS